ncbi:MAG: thioredoxin family protein [Pyrinomonadaceae bacterium]
MKSFTTNVTVLSLTLTAWFCAAADARAQVVVTEVPSAAPEANPIRKGRAPLPTNVRASKPSPAREAPPRPVSLSWYEGAAGYARAEREQKQSQAPLVVYFYADWCGYCRQLDQQFFPSAEVQRFLRDAVKVRINPEAGLEERALARRYGVSGYPAFFVIAGESARPQRVHPFMRSGTMSPAQFADACRKAAAQGARGRAAR